MKLQLYSSHNNVQGRTTRHVIIATMVLLNNYHDIVTSWALIVTIVTAEAVCWDCLHCSSTACSSPIDHMPVCCFLFNTWRCHCCSLRVTPLLVQPMRA